MKRHILVLTAVFLISLTATAAGIVNHSDDGNGDVSITSSGTSASASAGVSENGTEWTANVEMSGSSCMDGGQSDGLTSVTQSEAADGIYTVEFSGVMQTPNPCHVIDHEIEQTAEDEYVMRITSEAQGDVCEQCVGAISYDASFEARNAFSLTIMHDGETVDTVEHRGASDGTPPETGEQQQSIFGAIIQWFNSLF